jgi:hypothetical protein
MSVDPAGERPAPETTVSARYREEELAAVDNEDRGREDGLMDVECHVYSVVDYVNSAIVERNHVNQLHLLASSALVISL